MEVALIGKGPGKELAPLKGKGITTWGVNDLIRERDCDVCFWMDGHYDPTGHEQLHENITVSANTTGVLVYSTEKLDSIKNSARYPIEEVKECFGTDYFSDSCCYMIALAIYQGFKHLKLYGFTYGWGSNYVEEKPGVSFWLGVALGKGLKVSIFGEHSALLKTSDNLMYAYLCDQESSRENIRIVDFQVPTDEVEFGITDRVQLIGFLPKEGDYETVKFSKYLRSHLLFDVEESKQLNFKQVADKTHKDKPFIIWDKNEIPPKKIDLTMAEKSMIASWLFDANDRGKITYDNIDLYDKFCLGDST